jgi:superfamily II DNA or RNA helicase
MSLEQWQIALRRHFGKEQKLRLKVNADGSLTVSNPRSGGRYQVRVRGGMREGSHCSCPDFLVNTLGTCKHIEFALAKLERKRVRSGPLRSAQPRHGELVLRYGGKREILFRPGSGSPDSLRRAMGEYFEPGGVLRRDRYRDLDQFLKRARELDPSLYCQSEALSFLAQVRDQERLAERTAKLFPEGAASPAFERLLKTTLFPYQREGALFAARAGRCVIADDMGLGKTIQAIAAAEILARTAGIERILVVCPTSLKHQWKQEIEKFAGRPVEIVEGLLQARRQKYATPSLYKIVNYDVIHRDLPEIRAWSPDLIILDEAQRIKNWKTRVAKSVKQLPSEYAFVLTGTPLENRLEELHSIVEFVDRFQLGPAFRFLAEHQILDAHGKVVGYRNLTKISETLKPVLIRRTKAEVLKQLPQRLDKNLFVVMTPEQKRYHEENRETVARIVAKWRRFGFLTEKDQRHLMIALQNMRMSCNSTYLLDGKTDHGVKFDELKSLLAETLEEKGSKVVIFSQWIRTHELIIRRLERIRGLGGKGKGFVFLHGGVSSKGRRELIQRFKEDPGCRVFLSTDAGGVGLNLQAASTVVNMDLPWNPAVLEQRIGRVHRLGQSRPVRVINFISEGTIEQGMLGLLSFKKSLFAGALDGGQDEISLGGTQLTRFMDSVEKASAGMSDPEDTAAGQATSQAAPPDSVQTPAIDSPSTAASESAAGIPPAAANELIAAAAGFLEKLQASLGQPGTPSAPAITREERDGKEYLRIPVPSRDTLRTFGSLLQSLGKMLESQP